MQTYDLNKLRKQLSALNADSRKIAYDEDFALFDNITQIPFPREAARAGMGVFGLCLEGEGIVEVDARPVEFRKNCYFILHPNQIVRLNAAQSSSKGIFICVSNNLYEELIHRMQDMLPMFFYIREKPCSELPDDDAQWIERYHKQIFLELQNTANMFRRQTAKALLIALLYKILNIYSSNIISTAPQGNRKEEIFTLFLQQLTDNYTRHRDVAWYADQLCVTPKYMSTIVKQVSGQTANQWIQAYVIKEAKSQLKDTNLTIQQIAFNLSFPSQSFFGKYFRHLTGMSPTQFRQNS